MVPLKPLWYHQPLLFTIPSLSSDTPNVGEHLVSCLLQHFYCPHTLVHSFNCFLRSFSLSGTEILIYVLFLPFYTRVFLKDPENNSTFKEG